MKLKYLVIILILFLVGCGNIKVDREKLLAKLETKFDSMIEISTQELKSFYEIDTSKFKDYVFKISYDGPINIYILVLPTNKKEAKAEIEKFLKKQITLVNESDKKRINSKYSNTFGDYLFYVVSNDNKKIYKEINEYLKSE